MVGCSLGTFEIQHTVAAGGRRSTKVESREAGIVKAKLAKDAQYVLGKPGPQRARFSSCLFVN